MYFLGNMELNILLCCIKSKQMTDFQIAIQHDSNSKKFSEVYAHCQRLSATDLLSFIQKVQINVKPELKAVYVAAIYQFQKNNAIANKGSIR